MPQDPLSNELDHQEEKAKLFLFLPKITLVRKQLAKHTADPQAQNIHKAVGPHAGVQYKTSNGQVSSKANKSCCIIHKISKLENYKLTFQTRGKIEYHNEKWVGNSQDITQNTIWFSNSENKSIGGYLHQKPK